MKLKKYAIILFLLVSILFLGKWGISNALAQSCNNQSECQNLIDQYQAQITQLQGQAKTLSNQIAQFNAQINLMTLKIQQTEDKILLLGGRIDQLEISLDALSKAFAGRAVETYKIARAGSNFLFLLTSSDLTEAVSRFRYLQMVQGEDTNFLQRLQTAQVDYKSQKTTQEQLQTELQQEKDNLNAQKTAKANLLAATQNNEAKYQQLLAQAIAQRNAFLSFVNSRGGASILQNQTFCDGWGCYYNQRDSQWGNTPLGSSSLSTAEYGCLVSSSAMIATHYGHSLTPLDIATTQSSFFSPDSQTALLLYSINVKGATIQRTRLGSSTSNIDSEISAGRPVVVGLFGGPGHFIVIKSGSNGNYTMNDPFTENGHDIGFTSKYNLSDITDVERVDVY